MHNPIAIKTNHLQKETFGSRAESIINDELMYLQNTLCILSSDLHRPLYRKTPAKERNAKHSHGRETRTPNDELKKSRRTAVTIQWLKDKIS